MPWERIASAAEVVAARPKGVRKGRYALFFVSGKYFCIDAACPHAGHWLSRGHCVDLEDLCGPVVSCPAHSYVYDLETGTCVSALGGGPGRSVVHDIKVEDDDTIWVRDKPQQPQELSLPTETQNEIALRVVASALGLNHSST